MTLGQRIQQLRKEHNLSQEALGEQLGVSRQAISKWESDITIPEIDKLIALSKLFGVSVGTLLGVEEDSPDSPAAEELTDRELLAIEAIVERYLKRAQQQKPKRRIWPILVALAILLILVFWFKGQLETLNGRLSNLQNNVSSINNTVSSQINSMTNQIQSILEAEASLLADFNCEVTAVDIPSNTLTMTVQATPKNYIEGMELLFTADLLDAEPVTIAGTPAAGHIFCAEGWIIPLNDEIKLSATFGVNGNWQTQSLDTLVGWGPGDTALVVDASLHDSGHLITYEWEPYWISEASVSGYLVHKSQATLLAKVSPASAQLQLHKNGELLETFPVTLLPTDDSITRFMSGDIETSTPVQNGDQIMYTLLYTDNYGRTFRHDLEGVDFSLNKQGELDFSRMAPAMPGGSTVEYNYTVSN